MNHVQTADIAFLGARFRVAPDAISVGATPMIALTGRRHVGKSTAATYLEDHFGYERLHAFGAGLEAARTYFECITGDDEIAERMVCGDLKDVPSQYLPGEVAPRFFLEKFGEFMGRQMGVDWTLGMEIDTYRAMSPRSPIVVESLIYEADWFHARGGYIVRLERPDYVGPSVPSDTAQAAIQADETITARTVGELEEHMCALAWRLAL